MTRTESWSGLWSPLGAEVPPPLLQRNEGKHDVAEEEGRVKAV